MKLPNLINQSSSYQLPDYNGGQINGYQEFKFVNKNDTGIVQVTIDITGNDLCSDSSRLIFDLIKNQVQSYNRFAKSFKTETITISDINLYAVYFNSGAFIQGCSDEQTFSIYMHDFEDSTFVRSFVKSIEIENL